jgi:hypothetical protein
MASKVEAPTCILALIWGPKPTAAREVFYYRLKFKRVAGQESQEVQDLTVHNTLRVVLSHTPALQNENFCTPIPPEPLLCLTVVSP